MKNVYLALAIVGAIAPYVFFIEHFNAAGLGLNLFVAGSADVGLIVALLLPGIMALSDGWPGPLLWLLAAMFSTLGLLNQDEWPAGQTAQA